MALTPIPHSARPPAAGAVPVAAADPGAKLTVSLRLRPRASPPASTTAGVPVKGRQFLSREDYEQQYGATAADLDAVAAFATAHQLTVTERDPGRRTVVLAGTVAQINAAFAISLQTFRTGAISYLGHAGPASVPAELADIVESVHGLDTRPLAHPMIRQAATGQSTSSLLPAQVANLYGFPTNSASGQTIGILEFGGGYRASDIQNYFQNIAKLPVPNVSFVGIDGVTNSPGVNTDVDTEVILDIAVAGSVAQGAKIVIYFAPNDDQGWVDAVTTAIHDKTNKPSVLSISWGGDESGWDNISAMTSAFAAAAALGISVFVSSGDTGSGSPAEVQYPASDPGLTGCGGTTISNVSGTSFTQTTWAGSGGGVSNVFAQPSWQSRAGIPVSTNPKGHIGRGVPDIAGNADPSSGYQLILNGQSIGVWGGTSAVAPLYAGLVAVLESALGGPLGFLNDNLYRFAGQDIFDDVTAGSNGSYDAGVGWDACTGWGNIWGNVFLSALGLPPTQQSVGIPAGVGRTPNHMDLFWVHPDGSINSTWWDANVANGAWDPTRVFAATVPSKAVAGPVAALARTPNHMDLFWVHPDGSINSTWWDANVANGAWDPARVFAATAPSKAAGPVTVVARTPNHMDLFWVHPDGSINSTWWDANVANGAWDPTRVFAATAPSKAVAGPVAVVARTPDHMDLFWVHPDGSINSTWWDANVANGAWDPARVFAATAPSKAAGPVAALARTPNHMDLFWVHPDGSINSTWWDANVANGAWDPTRVFAATAPSKAVADPVAVVARTPNHTDLFWVHPDGSINSTWWDANVANGAWDPTRVFAATAPSKAVPGPVTVMARTPVHMDLFWMHPDGSISSTWWDANVANGAWDLTRVFAATAPLAV